MRLGAFLGAIPEGQTENIVGVVQMYPPLHVDFSPKPLFFMENSLYNLKAVGADQMLLSLGNEPWN